MAFKKHKPIKINVDTSTIAHDSPEVEQRLERIQSNYAKFDELMVELEAKLPEERPDSTEEATGKTKLPRKPR